MRVSNVARSADWVKASHDTVTEDGFAFFAVSESDNDWTKYSHRFRVSFSGYTGSETLANFPVLVKISETGISGFRYADCKKPGGADLRFADADGNLLASEVDTWDTSGESLVWVKVPSLTAATKITAYYGWDFAPVVDSSAVWTGNGYVGVWHLNESALPLAESSGGSSPFTAGTYPQYVDCGAIGIKCLLYFNGEEVGDKNDTRTSLLKSSTVPLTLGGGGGGTSRIFPGSIDEVRISTVARSADWVKASHDTVTESSFAIYSSARENVKMGMFLIFR